MQDKMALFKQLYLLNPNTTEVLYLRLTGEFILRKFGEIVRDENNNIIGLKPDIPHKVSFRIPLMM